MRLLPIYIQYIIIIPTYLTPLTLLSLVSTLITQLNLHQRKFCYSKVGRNIVLMMFSHCHDESQINLSLTSVYVLCGFWKPCLGDKSWHYTYKL